jgi:uncharacterized membrane protein YkvA (DUF1232 family)
MDQSGSAGTVVLIGLVAVLAVIFAVAVFLLVKLLRMFSIVRSDAMPVQGKVTFWAALIYAVFPVDLLPDPIYLDDIGVLAAAVAYLANLATKHGITRKGTVPAAAELDDKLRRTP